MKSKTKTKTIKPRRAKSVPKMKIKKSTRINKDKKSKDKLAQPIKLKNALVFIAKFLEAELLLMTSILRI